jgi:DNA-binding winged helix-turn-helix (wHTH) protein
MTTETRNSTPEEEFEKPLLFQLSNEYVFDPSSGEIQTIDKHIICRFSENDNALFEYLVSHHDKTIPNHVLLKEVWKYTPLRSKNHRYDLQLIHEATFRIREKLKQIDMKLYIRLETVKKRGIRWRQDLLNEDDVALMEDFSI